MTSFTVFYSWQSDRDSELCRDFIRIALEEAADRLKDRLEIEVVIDSDTQGVPGTPPITDTILKKIDACDLFIAAMTFVAKTESGKKTPNPNVMGEYGYALHAKGTRRILLAMNAAFGPPDDLPFDLHHMRHPAVYEAPEGISDGERRKARNKLSGKLENYIELILNDIRVSAPAAADVGPALDDLWWSTVSARHVNDPPALVSEPRASLHLVPAAALERLRIDPGQVKQHRGLLLPLENFVAVKGQSDTQWWAHGPKEPVADKPNPETAWYARLLRPGIIEHVFTIGRRFHGDPEIMISGEDVEAFIVRRADRALELLQALGLSGPTLIGVTLDGLTDVHLRWSHVVGRFRRPDLVLGSALIPGGSRRSADFLQDLFNRLWLGAGIEEGTPSYRAGEWAGYASDTAYWPG